MSEPYDLIGPHLPCTYCITSLLADNLRRGFHDVFFYELPCHLQRAQHVLRNLTARLSCHRVATRFPDCQKSSSPASIFSPSLNSSGRYFRFTFTVPQAYVDLSRRSKNKGTLVK